MIKFISLLISSPILCLSCATTPGALEPWFMEDSSEAGSSGSLLAEDGIVVTSQSGSKVTYADAEKAIRKKLTDGSIQVKVFLAFRIVEPLDPFGKMELIVFSSASESSGGDELKPKARRSTNSGYQAGVVYPIGEIYAKDVGADVDTIVCNLKIIEDDGIGADQEAMHQEAMRSLEAYAQSDGPSVGETVVKYTPVLPIVFDVSNWILGDDLVEPTSITLTKSQAFMPSVNDLAFRKGALNVAYIVEVAGYSFSTKEIHANEELRKKILGQ
jgi:hypothetical protein